MQVFFIIKVLIFNNIVPISIEKNDLLGNTSMQHQNLFVLLLASSAVTGCISGGKSSKVVWNDQAPPPPPYIYTNYKRAHPNYVLIKNPSNPFTGYSFRTTYANGVAIDFEVAESKLNKIKETLRKILTLPKGSDQLGLLKNNLDKAGEDLKSDAYLGNNLLDNCIGKLLLTKNNTEIFITKKIIDEIKKNLDQLFIDTIKEESRKAKEEMDYEGSDTDSEFSTDADRESDLDSMDSNIFMRHAKNGEIDIRLTDWYKSDIKIPFYARVEKSTEHTLSNIEFVKFGNILFGAKQKFNTLKNSLESLGATNTIMFRSAFVELHVETTKSTQSQKKITLGYDFKEWGITPYLQARWLKNSYAICGITIEAYNKQSALLKYSLNFNTQAIRNLTGGTTTYTLSTYGIVNLTDSVKASYTFRLAPNYTEAKLSLGFEL